MKKLKVLTIVLSSVSVIYSAGVSAESKKDDFSIKPLMNHMKTFKLKTKTVGDQVTHYMDYNRNGVADAEYTYIAGKLFTEKIDLNNDGKWDKSVWYYKEGEVLSTLTLDSNFDGKVDIKIVKTTKDAKPGFFYKKTYKDNNFDGKFDTKKSTLVNNHQAANANEPGHKHCLNCERRALEQAHYPAILDSDNETVLEDLLDKVSNSSLIDDMYDRPGVDGIGYTFNIQKECKTSPQHKNLLTRTNIMEGLKKGFTCMRKLATAGETNVANTTQVNRISNANHNLYRAVGGLVGYDFFGTQDGETYKYTPHGQYLSFVCKAPNIPGLFSTSSNMTAQYDSDVSANVRTINARATVSRENGLNNHVNRLSGAGFAAPNIAFNPKLAANLGAESLDYAGQSVPAKMQKLIFHEFLHTSLGTEHSENEDSLPPNAIHDFKTVDLAATCGDYCFNNPSLGDSIGTEIKRISGEICGGNYVTPDARYDAKFSRLKCLKKLYGDYSDKNITPNIGSLCPDENPPFQ